MSSSVDWSPCLAGIGIGALSWLVFVVVTTPVGITTAASQVAGGVASLVVLFGAAFGWLLHRGRVTDYNVIVDQRYRPGTAVAAVGTNILSVWTLSKITLADVTWVPALVLYLILAALASMLFAFLEKQRSGVRERHSIGPNYISLHD